MMRELGAKTDELSVDKATTRAADWYINSVLGDVRRRTVPKKTPEAKQDEAGAVVPDAVRTLCYAVSGSSRPWNNT